MSATTVAPGTQVPEAGTGRAGRRIRRATRRATRSHWIAGWRDGRARRPSVETSPEIPERLVPLVGAAESSSEKHWKTLLLATRDARVELATVPDEIKRAIVRSERASAALAAHLNAGPAAERRLGEERMPEALVQTRRAREHAARTTELTEARDKRSNYVHMKAQRQRALRAELALALESAAADARSDLAAFDALAAAYQRGVLRTHSDPVALEQQGHRFKIPRPEWVRFADVDEFLRAAEAGSDRA